MVDYGERIDAQTWAFIRQSEKFFPPDSAEQGIHEQRRRYDAMCRAFSRGRPGGVRARDRDADGVRVRIYGSGARQTGVSVLYAHGGSFMLGGLESHDDVCAEICGATGHGVIAVDYRLCPEFSRLDAEADMRRVLDWLRRERGGAIIGVGDSAGGYLIAALMGANRGAADLIGQVLIYPGLSLNREGGSMVAHAFAPLLSRAEICAVRDIVNGGTATGGDFLSGEADFSGLPLSVTLSAECDPLADDGRDYARAINAAGGKAFWFLDKGLVHGHLRARHTVRRAGKSFERVLRAISLIGAGQGFGRTDLES